VTVKEGSAPRQYGELLHRHRIEKVLIVDDQFGLQGQMTVRNIEKAACPTPTPPRMTRVPSAGGRCRGYAAPITPERIAALAAGGCAMWWW